MTTSDSTPRPPAPAGSLLTDRYVQAVLRRLPADQRPDIERELRASIADATDGRVEAGNDPAVAERETLTELGDPARLAAGYTDRPLHLIGPALFLDYTRVLTVVLLVAVPITSAVVAVTGAVERDSTAGNVIASAVGAATTTTVHIVFWTTLVFAILERIPGLRWTSIRPWTPDNLPEPRSRRAATGELIGETVLVVIFATLVLLSPLLRFRADSDGAPIPLLSPWLWTTGLVYVFVTLTAVSLAFDYVKHYVRWNAVVAVLAGLAGLASAALVVWLGTEHRVLNPEFTAAAAWPAGVAMWVDRGLVIAGALTIAVTTIQTIISLVTRTWNRGDLGSVVQSAARGLPGSGRR